MSPGMFRWRSHRTSADPNLTVARFLVAAKRCTGAAPSLGDDVRFAATRTLGCDADAEYLMIDATIIRAHQHSAGARKKGAKTRPSGAPGAV